MFDHLVQQFRYTHSVVKLHVQHNSDETGPSDALQPSDKVERGIVHKQTTIGELLDNIQANFTQDSDETQSYALYFNEKPLGPHQTLKDLPDPLELSFRRSSHLQAVNLLQLTEIESKQTFDIPYLPCVVGRVKRQAREQPDVDLGQLEKEKSRSVSGRHARLRQNQADATIFIIENLTEYNRVLVNGEKVLAGTLHPFTPPVDLVLGKVQLRLDWRR